MAALCRHEFELRGIARRPAHPAHLTIRREAWRQNDTDRRADARAAARDRYNAVDCNASARHFTGQRNRKALPGARQRVVRLPKFGDRGLETARC